jgi:hypothetical protein
MNLAELYSGVFDAFQKRYKKMGVHESYPESLDGATKAANMYLSLASFEKESINTDGTLEVIAHFEVRYYLPQIDGETEPELERRARALAGSIATFVTQNNFKIDGTYEAEFIDAWDESATYAKGLFKAWMLNFDVTAQISEHHPEDTELESGGFTDEEIKNAVLSWDETP